MNREIESTKTKCQIRWMIRRDMPAILIIENDAFEFPWTEDNFVYHLRQRNTIGMVTEIDDQIAGYMLYELQKGVLQIVNFAVAREFQRRGVGTAMVEKLVSKLSVQNRTKIKVMVRESNLAALRFFRVSGFYATGLVKQPFEECDDDGIKMVFDI